VFCPEKGNRELPLPASFLQVTSHGFSSPIRPRADAVPFCLDRVEIPAVSAYLSVENGLHNFPFVNEFYLRFYFETVKMVYKIQPGWPKIAGKRV